VFVFVLSDNVLASHWCLEELKAAILNGCDIVLVNKEGSRWPDSTGVPAATFPSYNLISSLPAPCPDAFSSKAIAHSDEYYRTFLEQLMHRIDKVCAPAATNAQSSTALVGPAPPRRRAPPAVHQPR
jgi:hypothetical protein